MKFLEINPSLKKYFGNEGTFTDPRDGNTYKTIEIDGQVWLAENLRYEGVEHYAPKNDPRLKNFYGILYKWEDALQACPAGWHLPSKKEFEDLLKIAGSTNEERFKNLIEYWWPYVGKDLLKFRALPAGIINEEGMPRYFDRAAEFWSNENVSLYVSSSYVGLGAPEIDEALSVRCIKD